LSAESHCRPAAANRLIIVECGTCDRDSAARASKGKFFMGMSDQLRGQGVKNG